MLMRAERAPPKGPHGFWRKQSATMKEMGKPGSVALEDWLSVVLIWYPLLIRAERAQPRDRL